MSDTLIKLRISIPPVEGVEDAPIAAVAALAHKMGFSEDRVQDIIQALTEACVNSILYTTPSEVDIEVMVAMSEKSLMIEVRDQGPGFNPDNVKEPNFEEISEMGTKNGGGFGIHMIKGLVDKVEIESSRKGTIVRMYAYLP
jgi:serine/threonine-protein kinase RsbW